MLVGIASLPMLAMALFKGRTDSQQKVQDVL